MTLGSLFAGIGGFDLAFEREGFKTLWQVELDKNCRQLLDSKWPDIDGWDDVATFNDDRFLCPTVITFGSPCQDLSIAGQRRGLSGSRSGLFFHATRVIDQFVGRGLEFALWENVPGCLSSNGGRDFAAVLGALAQCGAVDIAWRILDAQWFGLAQRRKRVFLVADFRAERAAEVLSLAESLQGHPAPRRETRSAVAGSLAAGAHPGGYNGRDAETGNLLAFGGNNTQGQLEVATACREHTPHFDFETETFVAHTLNSGRDGYNDGSDQTYVPVAFSSKDSGADARNISPTLRSMNYDKSHINGGGQVAIASHWGVRRLTPKECARLMGFPDTWLESYASKEEAHAAQILHELWRKIGTQGGETEWGTGSYSAILTPQILLAGVYGGWVSWEMATHCARSRREIQGPNACSENFVRCLRQAWQAGRSPYQRRSFGQLAIELGSPLPELPLEEAQAIEALQSSRLWPQAQKEWPLRYAFPEGKARSIGFSDSARYRMLGNAVAVPVAQYIARNLKHAAA